MDYELTPKIRNAPMLRIMRSSGYETAAELSRACGIAQVEIGRMLNLRHTAYTREGQLRSMVARLADFLGVFPDDMYPETHLHDPLMRDEFIAQVSSQQMERLTEDTKNPEQAVIELESSGRFDALCSALSERSRRIITSRFKCGKTYAEIGADEGVSVERIRQLLIKAQRLMRVNESRKAITP